MCLLISISVLEKNLFNSWCAVSLMPTRQSIAEARCSVMRGIADCTITVLLRCLLDHSYTYSALHVPVD